MPRYLELEIEPLNLSPRVWRRILMPTAATLLDLHDAIQSLGWEDCHLWCFEKKRHEVITDAETTGESGLKPADEIELGSLFRRKGSRCRYIYDFGDSWVHEIRCLGRSDHEEHFDRLLLAGAGAFPPEDSGGPWGLGDKLRARASGDEENSWAAEWLGDWDPEAFDLEDEKKRFDLIR